MQDEAQREIIGPEPRSLSEASWDSSSGLSRSKPVPPLSRAAGLSWAAGSVLGGRLCPAGQPFSRRVRGALRRGGRASGQPLARAAPRSLWCAHVVVQLAFEQRFQLEHF